MKIILSVYPINPPLTGIGRYTWELATRLRRFDTIDSVRFFNLGRWVTDPDTLLSGPGGTGSIRSVLASSPMATRLYEKLSPLLYRAQLGRYSDHIYHSPNFFLPPFPGKSIATFHDLSVYRYPHYHLPASVGLLEREIPRALKRADRLIVVSEFTKREIVELLGYPEERISVVPNGVSAAFHPREKSLLAGTLGKFGLIPGQYFLSVATLEPRKNIGSILDAYEGLPSSITGNFPLVICGDAGWKSQEIHNRIQSMATRGLVRHIGYISHQDLPLLYSGARALVYVPFYEGFGLPALEAMASGVPVIASNSSSLPEVVGDAGYCVEPLDVDMISSHMEMLAEGSAEVDRRVDIGLALAQGLSWERCAASTVQIYQQVWGAGQG